MEYVGNLEGAKIVSIIVLTCNATSLTLRALQKIQKYTNASIFEVILVDNGSNSSNKKLLKEEMKKIIGISVECIFLDKNYGYAEANNIGASRAHGQFLVFLNNDVMVTKGWLNPMIAFLKKHSDVAACQPKLHSYKQKHFFDYAGGAGGFLDIFGYTFTRGRIFESIEKDFGQYNQNMEITWACGACLVIKKDIFREIGGFDPNYFAYFEEVDLCIRLKRLGYKIYCFPKITVFHYGAFTSNRNLDRKMFFLHRNSLYFLLKNYSFYPYLLLFIFKVLFDGGAVAYYLWNKKFGYAQTVFVAYFEILRQIPSLIREKTITLKGKSLFFDDNIYKGSIIIDYFLLRKRNFLDLRGERSFKSNDYKGYSDITYSLIKNS